MLGYKLVLLSFTTFNVIVITDTTEDEIINGG